ncbi:aldo/keto reductase [Alphaproteobacteria bacterium KMM 3653]|uniref:Aldo/keto reductase n=1 Tax=Harenicola maris TaxID=2841044 RepID=A0AAP2CR24_9RHOB|nr:aldo/keto reductase [Harenicola maris]
MKMMKLGRTDMSVSQLCLGTMTFGTQTSEAEGHGQMDAALDAGINFVDTAEVYPVNPMAKETAGRTEEILGTWNAKSGRRGEYILATKVSGKGNKNVRDGAPISAATIRAGIEGSLRRLQTDYIDLYQLHWPNRGSYMFRQNWTYDPSGQVRAETVEHMEEVVTTLQEEVKAGRIRAFGLSNESAWGTMMWLQVAERLGGPRVASVQNEYSLMCRLYDTDMAELSHNEDVALLAFSPLACGYLSGKYSNGAVPEGSRLALNGTLGGRANPRAFATADVYCAIAAKHGLDPVQMSIAWCCQRPFPVMPIFGATTQAQLDVILAGKDLVLSQEVLDDLTQAHRDYPMPY